MIKILSNGLKLKWTFYSGSTGLSSFVPAAAFRHSWICASSFLYELIFGDLNAKLKYLNHLTVHKPLSYIIFEPRS